MKGQSAIEFLILLSMSALLLAALYGLLGFKNLQASNLQSSRQAVDVADNLAFQVEMAVVQGEGYSRVFSLPSKIGGRNYSASIRSGYVVINYLNNSLNRRTLYNRSDIKITEFNKGNFRVLHNDSGVHITQIG